MEKEILFSLRGVDVYSDSVYVVKHKPDPTAPTGLKALNATKYPGAGISDDHGFPTHALSNGDRIFVTGFDADAPLYNSMDEATKKKALANAQRVLKNYRNLKGVPDLFDRKNNLDSIKTAMFTVYDGQNFHTGNPEDVMNLYVSLLSGKLCPKGKEGSPLFVDTNYIVYNATGDAKEADTTAISAFEAMKAFETLLGERKENNKLINVLYYMDITATENLSDDAFKALFINRIFNDSNRTQEFYKKVKEVLTDKGYQRMEIYRLLAKMQGKSSKLTKEPKRPFYYNGIEVGVDLKGAASNIAQNPELEEVKAELLEL
jgi:hypothetical protein